jgi:uncharacterized protein (TIGR03435 family)
MIGPRNDGEMVTYTRMSIKSLVRVAYGVKDYQVTGPAWMDSLQFDISAKIPDGGSKDDAPEMLKALLKERFQLAVHIEKKDHPIYALVVGKGGPKLKPAEIAPAGAEPKIAGNAPPPPPPPPGAGGGRGPGGPLPPGGMRMQMGPNGGHIETRAATLPRFAESISRFLDRPVIDQTGIEGTYDFTLDISSDEMANMMAQMRASMPMMGAGRGGPGPGGGGDQGPGNMPEAGSVFQSIQQYGLKLEPKKAAMDIVTIDSALKTPTEN